nr:hypothetical protein [uncultured bacterium]
MKNVLVKTAAVSAAALASLLTAAGVASAQSTDSSTVTPDQIVAELDSADATINGLLGGWKHGPR